MKEDVSIKAKVVHESQVDHSKGFGGKFGVQKDRRDSCAEGRDFEIYWKNWNRKYFCLKFVFAW